MPRTSCIITSFAITSLLWVAGCSNGGDDFKPVSDSQPEVPEAAHDHHHEHGPNGGHIIELGDDEMYHAELVFDADSRKTTIYILDGEAKSASPIDATEIELHLEGEDDEVELTLDAVPLESEGHPFWPPGAADHLKRQWAVLLRAVATSTSSRDGAVR